MGMLPFKVAGKAAGLLLGTVFAVSQCAAAAPLEAPSLSNQSDYSEYWEQQFLFDNNTVATSQFLIANLPFSKHHGMMVATLKEPGKEAVIIKNGRKRSGWNFADEEPQLSIFQHQLSGSTPSFKLQLHNTAAELDVNFSAKDDAIALVAADNKLGLPTVTLYAPSATAQARWRDGPEIGGPGPDGAWREIGAGRGYGIHVVQTKAPNAMMKRWRRFTSINSNGSQEPLLHAFETPDGETHFALLLVSKAGAPSRFDVEDFSFSEDGKSWHVKGYSGDRKLSGEMELGGLLETFNLKDQLNGLEKLAAGSMADVNRLRYTATYEFTITEGEQKTVLRGKALAEDIQMGKVKAKRRRTRR